MIELRADGSIPGKPKVARIYKAAVEGVMTLRHWEGEYVTDVPPYLEASSHFRGWVSEFFDISEVKVNLENLQGLITKEEREAEKAKHLKVVLLEQHRKAEKAAYDYFASCPVGPERTRAYSIYENVRNALRSFI